MMDFNIPKGTKRIEITFTGVSIQKEQWWVRVLNWFGIHKYDSCQIVLGDVNGIETSGYTVGDKQ